MSATAGRPRGRPAITTPSRSHHDEGHARPRDQRGVVAGMTEVRVRVVDVVSRPGAVCLATINAAAARGHRAYHGEPTRSAHEFHDRSPSLPTACSAI